MSRADAAIPSVGGLRIGWSWPTVGITLAAIGVVFWSTFASLVSVWRQSDTFAHCFLIAPIVVYLVWRKRAEVDCTEKRISWLGLAAMLVLSIGWLVATSANVQVGRQLTAVLMLPAAVLALLGTEATKKIAFPLAYLLFAVPFGEVLIPPLMSFTASFAVAALKLTGIPVLREGMYFTIPSGDFEVAKACSGIRYLIACVALGLLYSYLSFRSWRKRAVFIAVSLVAPVIANGVRAYLIVMLAHLSGMKLAVGVDHLIYGWVLFGGLVALLFWVGSFFQDPPAPAAAVSLDWSSPRGLTAPRAIGAALAAVVLAAAGPILVYSRGAAASDDLAATVPQVAGWEGPLSFSASWRRAVTPRRELLASYAAASGRVDLEVLVYGAQQQDVEMVGAVDSMIDLKRWQMLDNHSADTLLPPGFAPREVVLREGAEQRVVWYWYFIGSAHTAEDWRAKALEAWRTLTGAPADSTLILLSTEHGDLTAARALLGDFARQALPAIDGCVRAPGAACAAR